MTRTKIHIEVEEVSQPDHLGRPTIHYSVAKKHGIKKGVEFKTPCGTFRPVEYIDWNPATNRRFSGFACEEVK